MTRWRNAAVGGSVALALVVLAVSPAWAGAAPVAAARASAPVARGTGSAQALSFEFTAGGRTLSAGTSAAGLTSAGDATAAGDGSLTGLPSAGSVENPLATAPSEVSAGVGHRATQARACALTATGLGHGAADPAGAVMASGGTAVECSSAQVFSSTSTAGAKGSGQLQSTSFDLTEALAKLPVGSVTSALTAALGHLPSLPAPATPLGQVLGTLTKGSQAQAITLSAMPSISDVSWSGRQGAASASAGVAAIDLFPGLGSAGGPLARILVGPSAAAVSYGGAAAGAAPEVAHPAPITVELAPRGATPQSVTLAPGQSFTLFAGTPLRSSITVGSADAVTSPNGTETASATGARIDLLQGVPQASIDLTFATATATVTPPAATPPAGPPPAGSPPPAAPPAVPGATVPHTGLPWAGAAVPLAGAGIAGLGLLGWSLRRPRSGARRRAPWRRG